MRTLPASVVLSSMVLGGWLAGAKAQNVDLNSPPPLNSPPGAQADEAGTPPLGVIPQPTPEFPGTVVGITLGELYTDNLRLASQDRPKQSAWITEIQPFLNAARSSPRFSGMFDANLTGYLYAGQASHDQLVPDLDANGTVTILPQHFFLDGTATYSRQIINNQLPFGSGTYFLNNNNRTNVATAMLSPYWLQDLGNAGTMTVRLSRGRVVYSDRGIPGENRGLLNGIPNVTVSGGQFSWVSPKYQTWGWNLSYSEQRVDPDFGQGWDFARARVEGSYEVNRRLRLLADAGKENKFLPDGSVQKLGAPFWDLGFEWATSRDRVRFLGGHRFFGRSFELSWTHQAALLTTVVSYVEQPTTYNQQLLGMNPDAEALPPITTRSYIPSLRERQPYLSKRLSASAVYTMPKSTLTAQVYDESRTYFEQNDAKERVANADIFWAFNVGALTTLTPSYRWQRYQFLTGQITYAHYAELALVHGFNARNFGTVKVRHDSSNVYFAASGAHGFTANVLFVQWTHLF